MSKISGNRALTALPSGLEKPEPGLLVALLAGLWFGIVAGLVEGAGLLLFQRINWARWGPMMHVSAEILWIAPFVDILLFLLAGVLVGAFSGVVRQNACRIAVPLLVFLATYDWLTVTGRLSRMACVLLALGVAVAFGRRLKKHGLPVQHFLKKTLPWVIAAGVLACASVQAGKWLHERSATLHLPKVASVAPNVIVIVVDTLRADHLSSYGYARPTSPNIDRLAKQGVLFENAVSTTSWSLPSHVSLITGRYLFEHGVGNVQPEPWLGWGRSGLGGLPTLGEALEQKGYRTGAFSANRTYFSRDLGFGRGFLHFEDYFHSPADMFVRTIYGREFARIYLKRSDKSLVKRILRGVGWTSLLDQDAEGSGSYGGAFGIRKHAEVVNEEVVRWIDHDREHPFFAFLNYFDVHDPYGGPGTCSKPWGQKTSLDLYDDSVKYVDDYIGRLMQELEKRDLAGKTLLIITSDHGESLGQHHLQTHGRSLYWELVHVPLVVWYPGHVPAGARVPQPVTNAAIPATILELIGASTGTWQGEPSLSKLWTTQTGGWPKPLSELVQNKYPGQHDKEADLLIPTATSGAMESIITSRWQLIRHEKSGRQLYDLIRDPGELSDLINTAEGKATGEKLAARITEEKKRLPAK